MDDKRRTEVSEVHGEPKTIGLIKETLPEHPSVMAGDSGADIDAPDRLDPGSGIDSLPTLASLPADWKLVSLHVIHAELNIGTTLPQIWEQSKKEDRERVLVRLPVDLIQGMMPPWMAQVCDAMPADVAEEFASWAGAQVFIRRSSGQYVECEVSRWVFRTPGGSRDGFIVTPATNRHVIRPAAGTWPVAFWQFQPDAGLVARAHYAHTDAEKLLTLLPHHYPLDKFGVPGQKTGVTYGGTNE